jgi:hypothetical protein
VLLPLLLLFLVPQYHSDFCDAHRMRSHTGIRSVDFCELSYPSIGSKRKDLGRPDSVVSLKNGVRQPEGEDGSGLITLEEIQYTDVTHDGREDALVTMVWHSGGTMQKSLVYVWSMKNSKPVVLWDFASGDRGFGGLHRVYGKDGDLILEVNDPDASVGNCCSRRFIRKRFRWDGSRFVKQGKRQVLPNPDYKE